VKWRLLAVACVLLALGLLLYPLLGELVSERYHSDVKTVYANAISDADDAELAEQRRTAEEYNALLRGEAAVSTGGASAPPVLYAEQLTMGGAMCTIDIPKIGVYLPHTLQVVPAVCASLHLVWQTLQTPSLLDQSCPAAEISTVLVCCVNALFSKIAV